MTSSGVFQKIASAWSEALCGLGLHRWGPCQDDLVPVPNEDDCARIFWGDGAWPNYRYKLCVACPARKSLPKTYVEVTDRRRSGHERRSEP